MTTLVETGPNNEERESTPETDIEREALTELHDLGLTWEDLEGKEVLDIGAGAANIARAAKLKGVDTTITSVEKDPEAWSTSDESIAEVPYVKSDACALLLPDENFDLVLSHGGPLTIGPDKTTIEISVREAVRVLRKGGSLRFGPGHLRATIFTSEELFTPEEEANFTTEERIQRIRERSLAFLKNVDPRIIQKEIKGNEPLHLRSYYQMQKQYR